MGTSCSVEDEDVPFSRSSSSSATLSGFLTEIRAEENRGGHGEIRHQVQREAEEEVLDGQYLSIPLTASRNAGDLPPAAERRDEAAVDLPSGSAGRSVSSSHRREQHHHQEEASYDSHNPLDLDALEEAAGSSSSSSSHSAGGGAHPERRQRHHRRRHSTSLQLASVQQRLAVTNQEEEAPTERQQQRVVMTPDEWVSSVIERSIAERDQLSAVTVARQLGFAMRSPVSGSLQVPQERGMGSTHSASVSGSQHVRAVVSTVPSDVLPPQNTFTPLAMPGNYAELLLELRHAE